MTCCDYQHNCFTPMFRHFESHVYDYDMDHIIIMVKEGVWGGGGGGEIVSRQCYLAQLLASISMYISRTL